MITWKETIEVILSTFSISQKDLSNYLSISESTLSRLKNGKIGTKLDYDIVFRDVFDPNTQGSPAHALNETESWLLSLLKETIEKRFKNVQKILVDKNCWEIENYKSFILEWLKLTRNDLTAEDYGNMEGLESSTEAPDEQMVRIFEQSISKYHIATYIAIMLLL